MPEKSLNDEDDSVLHELLDFDEMLEIIKNQDEIIGLIYKKTKEVNTNLKVMQLKKDIAKKSGKSLMTIRRIIDKKSKLL